MTSDIIPSYWQKSADSGSTYPQLEDTLNADVTIVGAGITGLRAAIELAKQNINVVVVDAKEPGWGASGRSGGQVNPLAHSSTDDIISKLGEKFGPRLIETYIQSADEVFSLIKEYDLKCDDVQQGWIRAAHCKSAIKQLQSMNDSWSKYGLDISFIEGKELHDLSGSQAYDVATLVPKGGCLHPLSYTRELARIATAKGVKIFSKSAVKKLSPTQDSHDRKWQISTQQGAITSDWVLFCTNGYSDNTLKGLKSTIVPLVSLQAVTRPLSPEEYAAVLPQGHTIADTRRVIYYSRKDNRDRLLLGSLGLSDQCSASDKRRIQKGFATVFPQFTEKDISMYWAGRIAFTPDLLPHLHEPAPGVLAGLGYNGRGIAMATVMGRILAERVGGKKQEDLALPATKFKPYAFHRFHQLGVSGALKCFELRDKLDVKFF